MFQSQEVKERELALQGWRGSNQAGPHSLGQVVSPLWASLSSIYKVGKYSHHTFCWRKQLLAHAGRQRLQIRKRGSVLMSSLRPWHFQSWKNVSLSPSIRFLPSTLGLLHLGWRETAALWILQGWFWNPSHFKRKFWDLKGCWAFPGGTVVKNPPASARDPWVGKILWRRKWQPTPVSLPRKFHGQSNVAGYSPLGCKESDMTERLSTHTHRGFCNTHHFSKLKKKGRNSLLAC